MSNGYPYGGTREDFLNEVEELDIIRLREITGKAISGTLLLLLKWFKRSRKKFSLSRDMFFY
jgi:hypothetical protein